MIYDFEDVVRWADVYACDNSSTLFEFAACGNPVVLMDAPWFPSDDGSWRFDKYRNLGPNLTDAELGDAAIHANDNRVSYDEMVTEVFGPVDGAAKRAANAIRDLHARSESRIPSTDTRTFDTQPTLLDL